MIRNIVRCLYMCEFMPFSDNNYNIFDNYAYFCASVALIDFFGAAAAAGSDNPNEILERFKQRSVLLLICFVIILTE